MTGRFDTYGPPSVELSAFRLWVHGREFPEATDSIDGNFLRITAHCAEKGASVVTTGSLLDTVSFVTFGTALQGLYDRLEGVAVLELIPRTVRRRLSSTDSFALLRGVPALRSARDGSEA